MGKNVLGQSALGVLGLLLVACSGSEALPELPVQGEELEQGVSYHHDLYVHCGVDDLIVGIGGVGWRSVEEVWDGVGPPPPGLAEGYDDRSDEIEGILTWVDDELVTFEVSKTGFVVEYQPTDESAVGCA